MASNIDSRETKHNSEHFRGWLLKWTNYIKGYQKRWFVLSNGLLSYYRTQEEMAHTCRGTINLAGATIDTIDATHFVITNGPSQVFHLRALNEVQRQRWVTALELAKAKAIKNLEDVSDEEKDNETPLTALKEKLTELITTHNLVQQKHHELLKVLSDIETGKEEGGTNFSKLKEKAAMFRVTTSAMAKVSGDYFTLAQTTDDHRRRSLMHERTLNIQLQENFESLAKQMHGLETQARMVSQKGIDIEKESDHKESPQLSTSSVGSSDVNSIASIEKPALVPKPSDVTITPGTAQRVKDTSNKKEVSFNLPSPQSPESPSNNSPHILVTSDSLSGDVDDEDEQFYDAIEASEIPEDQLATKKQLLHKRTESSVSMNESQLGTPIPKNVSQEYLPTGSLNSRMMTFTHAVPGLMTNVCPTIENRRTSISPRPNVRLSLWSVIKNCIGKDLSKIPIPVHFGEPLSFLQRISEEISYYKLLDQAAACSSTLDEAALVGAFAVSAYESPAIRVYKPFNPMLGETFELDRRAERGYRLLFEQVSHHPPMLAMHCEHKEWTFWQEYTLASKFRGKYIQCFPIGCMHLVFHRSGSHYTWNKVVVTIHNVIVGKLWVDYWGDMNIVNHTTGEKCELKFYSYSYFTRERQRKVTGQCLDKHGNPQKILRGYWDDYMECAPVISTNGKEVLTGPFNELWKVEKRPPGAEKTYYFSEYTASLNEMEDGVAPTDSRFRPDQRVMESGDFDEANRVKALLEEKQRERRRKREAIQSQAVEAASLGNHEEAKRLETEAAYTPTWFHKEYDPYSNTMLYVYNGKYWECKEKNEWGKHCLTDIFET